MPPGTPPVCLWACPQYFSVNTSLLDGAAATSTVGPSDGSAATTTISTPLPAWVNISGAIYGTASQLPPDAAAAVCVPPLPPGRVPGGAAVLGLPGDADPGAGVGITPSTVDVAVWLPQPLAVGPPVVALRVQLARRFHNDAVKDVQRVRRKTVVRWFRLAGHAELPATIEFDDELPPAVRE